MEIVQGLQQCTLNIHQAGFKKHISNSVFKQT